MGSLDHNRNITKKLANDRPRRKTFVVFVITKVSKERLKGMKMKTFSSLSLHSDFKTLVGIDLGVNRRVG